MFVLISQVFSILLAVIAISKSYLDFRARRDSLPMFVLWVLTWTAIVAVALFPHIVDFFLSGSRAGIGAFFGMAGVFMFFLLYRVYARVERLEQKITTLVQEVALREHVKSGTK